MSDLVAATVALGRALRERGALVTPGESAAAVAALEAVELGDRQDVYLALRTVLASRPQDYRAFDELFDAWWRDARAAALDAAARRDAGPRAHPPAPAPIPAPSLPPRSVPSLARWGRANDASDEEGAGLAAPSTLEAAGSKDFSTFAADEIDAVGQAAARIARRLSARPGRRWRAARHGARVDLRRTIRQALKTGGDPTEIVRRERRLRRTKLVALCDVSGSMDLYSRFLLQFLYALQRHVARIETFAFSTSLARITPHLARDSYREALDRLARSVPGWSGGTKIGESVAAFAREWPNLVDRRTVLVILSDGWDTGDPELLGASLRALRRRAGRVVWLNPLLGSPGYRPLTRGMQAALPHVDVFAPVHNLESLEALAHHLRI